MIHFRQKTGGLFNSDNIGNMPADIGNAAVDCMDTDLVEQLTQSDAMMSPTLFDFDALPDNCANSEPTPDTDDILLDLPALEEFMDLAEFLDFGQSSLPTDSLLQATSDVGDAAGCVQPPLPAASATSPYTTTASVQALTVFTSLADDASVTELSPDHTYHHPARRNTRSSSAARQAQYLERRRKNNMACKLSRQAHKLRLIDMEEELVRLEKVNAGLRERVVVLERTKQTLKSALVDAIKQAT